MIAARLSAARGGVSPTVRRRTPVTGARFQRTPPMPMGALPGVLLEAEIDGVRWPVSGLSLGGFELSSGPHAASLREISGTLICRCGGWSGQIDFVASLPVGRDSPMHARFAPMGAKEIDMLLEMLVRLDRERVPSSTAIVLWMRGFAWCADNRLVAGSLAGTAFVLLGILMTLLGARA